MMKLSKVDRPLFGLLALLTTLTIGWGVIESGCQQKKACDTNTTIAGGALMIGSMVLALLTAGCCYLQSRRAAQAEASEETAGQLRATP